MAFRLLGDELWERVGREPSGTLFHSLVQLEAEPGKPRNPFINAGALVVTDVLCRRFVKAETALVEFLRRLTGEATIDYDLRVAQSEAQCGSQPGYGAFHRELWQYGNACLCGSRRVLPAMCDLDTPAFLRF
jgi:glutaminase